MGGMGGQVVEAIVLSPAPAEEEEAAQEGRRPDQELWRQVNHEEKSSEKRQGSDVFGRDGEKEEKGRQRAGRGAGNNVSSSGDECDSKTTEIQAREDKNSREGKQKGTDRKKATEGTAKGGCWAIHWSEGGSRAGGWWAGAGHAERRDLMGGRGDLAKESWLGNLRQLSPATGKQGVISRTAVSATLARLFG